MKKTLIAIPCMDMVSARFAQSLATLKKQESCVVSFLIGSLIYDSRNKLAGYAVEMEADYVLWLDSDMVFRPDLLEHMRKVIDENDIDILTGLYFKRGYPFKPVLFSKLELNEKNECIFEDYEGIPEGITEVAGCGFGCVLMKADVLFDMASKQEDIGMWFTPMGNVGEDVAFCIRARDLGYKIYCDPSAHLGHMGYAPITKDFYKQLQGEQ